MAKEKIAESAERTGEDGKYCLKRVHVNWIGNSLFHDHRSIVGMSASNEVSEGTPSSQEFLGLRGRCMRLQ